MTPTESIRALVGRYQLGYYFNPGGCEFFSSAHPSIPHCQTSGGYEEEKDAAKLAAWCAQHEAVLTTPQPDTYLWYSEGQYPVRVIRGKCFHRCTLACQVDGDHGVEEWEQEFDDIEEIEGGWRLRCVTRGEPATYVIVKPDTPEARAEWEKRLFTDHP
jgi:hypothetical protein